MPRDLPPVLVIVLVFPVFFVALWLGITAILSVAGGWRALAARYPAPPGLAGEEHRFSSGTLRRGLLPVNYNHVLRVWITEGGIALATHFPFRFMHPPLFIPWQAVRECWTVSFLFWSGAGIRLHEPDVRITIGGRAGSAILEWWAQVQRP